ncbi:hypothetical protein GCM10009677_07090 [Sphaerisporangium rubeum]|uniref:Endoglucanase n=1 Tax=Sphaerisporangium rubeum TaxID=321317 RepID=A0A7X0ILC8_9ACTN|nr:cellulose-binding domain-containing protein [Sphaerisporangium rubeum]MBB6476859.1 endoglucanase [Sphaerisporangium rubeum]
MKGRLAVSWAVALLAAAGFLIPAVASAASGGTSGVATTTPPGSPSPSPSLLWPCYDPRTLPPSSPPKTPPTFTGTPEAVQVVNNYVRMRWTAATDPDGIACYQVFEVLNGNKVKVATFGPGVTEGSFAVAWPSGTTPTRVATIYVVAIDSWGAETASPSVQVTIHNDIITSPSPTPTPNPSGPCRVAYSSNGWPGGMTASVSITNTGTTAISGWRLTFTYPDPGQRVTGGWSATWSQTGSAVTATAMSWNQNIAPGATIVIGYYGVNQGANPSPTTFQLNGATCR